MCNTVIPKPVSTVHSVAARLLRHPSWWLSRLFQSKHDPVLRKKREQANCPLLRCLSDQVQLTTPNEVLAILSQLKVDHSDYLNRPVLDPDLVAKLDQANAGLPTYLNTRRIEAIVRDVKGSFPMSESIQVIFLFDEHDKLIKYELRSILTGP